MFKIILLNIFIGYASCVIYNYCDSDLCKFNSFKHITCESTGDLGPKCNNDARAIEITDDVAQKIVDNHNKFRNKIANGEQNGFKSAAKMATLEWDNDLADYAGLNVRRCEFKHDCHATPEMKHSGQNIYAIFAYVDDINELAEKAPASWYSEVEKATMAVINNCCDLNVGHFTQMVADRANRVGCAVAQFIEKGKKMTYMACNYSFGNLRDTNIYTVGAPASQCKSGNNPKYPALCSTAEEIDANSTK